MNGIHATYFIHGLVVHISVTSLSADIYFLISHQIRGRIAERVVKGFTPVSPAKFVTIAVLEAELIVQKASPVARVAAVGTETQHRRDAIESELTFLENTLETSLADLTRRIEEVPERTKLAEENYKQGETIQLNDAELHIVIKIALVDLVTPIEKMTALTKLVEYNSEQVEAIATMSPE